MHYIETILLALTGMLAIMSLILGLDKMMRIVLGNYIIMSILLGLYALLDILSLETLSMETSGFVMSTLRNIAHFVLANGKPTLLLTIYFLLLALVTTRIVIPFGQTRTDRQKALLSLICIPLTVVSILTNIAIAVFGTTIINIYELEFMVSNMFPHSPLLGLLSWVPLLIALPWLVVILIAGLVLNKPRGWSGGWSPSHTPA